MHISAKKIYYTICTTVCIYNSNKFAVKFAYAFIIFKYFLYSTFIQIKPCNTVYSTNNYSKKNLKYFFYHKREMKKLLGLVELLGLLGLLGLYDRVI